MPLPPSTTVINAGQVGLFTAFTADASGSPAPTIKGTATVSDYTSAYVASTGKANEYMVVGKVTPGVGAKVPITITFSGAVAIDGTVVADFTVAFELDGAVQGPATQIVLGPVTTPLASSVTVPPDPGSATIPMA